eukprot:m.257608 g.257608  ORF g.257608 m.257608 type:complete len:554 (-) comp26757_c1_seq24:24-1685(-)
MSLLFQTLTCCLTLTSSTIGCIVVRVLPLSFHHFFLVFWSSFVLLRFFSPLSFLMCMFFLTATCGTVYFASWFVLASSAPPPLGRSALLTLFVLGLWLLLVALATVFHKLEMSAPNVIQCLSLLRNWKSLVNTKQNPRNISCINGLRALTACWIVFSHVTEIEFFHPGMEMWQGQEIAHRFAFAWLVNPVPPETFFLIGGFLVGLKCLQHLNRTTPQNKPLWILGLYLHRFVRVAPPYYVVLLFIATVGKYLSTGPWWYLFEQKANQCAENWFFHVAFVDNYFPESSCLIWSWFLANDMQFFLLAPFALLVFYNSARKGYLLLLSALIAFVGFTTYIAFTNKLNASQHFGKVRPGAGNAQKLVYLPAYARVPPYIVGLLLSFLYHQYLKCSRNFMLPRMVVLVGYLASLVCLFLTVFGIHEATFGSRSQLVDALYIGFSRPVWGVCVGFIIFTCATGQAATVNGFLGHPYFIPLARVSFSLYLVHVTVIEFFFTTQPSAFTIVDVTILFKCCAFLFISLITATIFFLLVERPLTQFLGFLLLMGERGREGESE